MSVAPSDQVLESSFDGGECMIDRERWPTLAQTARMIEQRPTCNTAWLLDLYRAFVRREHVGQHGFWEEMPPHSEQRGNQQVIFDQIVFTGITPMDTLFSY